MGFYFQVEPSLFLRSIARLINKRLPAKRKPSKKEIHSVKKLYDEVFTLQ